MLLPYAEIIKKKSTFKKGKQNFREKFKGLKTSQLHCINEVEQQRKWGDDGGDSLGFNEGTGPADFPG